MKNSPARVVHILLFAFLLSIAPAVSAETLEEFDALIEPYQIIKVGSSVAGILEFVPVDRGDIVEKGQIVAKLKDEVERATMDLAKTRADLKATIKAREKEVAFAKRSEQRMKSLYDQKAIQFSKWDEAKTNRELAELKLAEAHENQRLARLEWKRSTEVVKRMTIRSPVNGVVVERFLHTGEYVEDQPIMELAQIHPLNIEIILPAKMYGSIKIGMPATVKPENPLDGSYAAEVTIVDRIIDAASGTFGVRLGLPNPDYKIPPGLRCKVIFQTSP